MQRKTIEYFDGEQKLIGELFYKDLAVQKTAIIVFPAFEGRAEFALDYAKKIAEQGYVAFVVDMYGDAATSNTIEGCFKLITPFLQDRELVRRRAVLAYEILLQQAHSNKIGAVGFCFGGMCVLELARSGANLQAGIGIHSVLAKSDLITHPIKSKLLMLHGYKDPQVPPTQLQAFAQELEQAGVKDWTFTFFGEAQHSFTDPRTGTFDAKKEIEMGRVYDPIAADRSWRYTLDFFKEYLN
jgi:dienelactone hydrolase